nr:penicillin-binding protein 2 [Wenjunlia vitaminophila]
MLAHPCPGTACPGTARPARPAAPRPRSGSAGGRPPRAPLGTRPLRLANHRPRLRLISMGLAMVLVVFVGRLLQLQVVDASAYAAKAAVNRYVEVPLPADRGAITDRNGVRLATTVDAYDITADPYLFTPEQAGTPDAPARAAALLSPVVGVDRATLEKKLSTPDSRYVLLARQRSPQAWKKIKDLKASLAGATGGNVLAGVFAQEHSKRVYPAGDLAAGVLGFVNTSGEGGAGLEQVLQDRLSGKDGKRTNARAGGRQVSGAGTREQPAVPGEDVELTLDRDIQWAAQDAITRQVEESAADRGYVIVQDTRTGEVLAMASAPGFDPNDYARADPEQLGNPALQDAYEPGSVSKLMTMAAVLEEGVATWDTKITVPNTLRRADRVFHDDIDHPTWYLTLNGVLAKSSNLGTITVAEALGGDQAESNRILHRYLRKFGIGSKTGVGLPGETQGLLASPEDWNASQQYTIPFGQGLSVNALQSTSVFSTVANGGVRVEPSLIRGSTGPDGKFVPAPAPKKTRVISERNAKTLSRMLESVVGDDQGTGTRAQIPGYRVAGKTGTANRVDPVTGQYSGYTSSFLGFAPADNPRLTVSCVIQNPTRGSYFGGQICGPVFKRVMEFSLKTLKVPPTGTKASALPVEFTPGPG